MTTFPFIQKAFNKPFRIVLLLSALLWILCYLRFPEFLYNSIIFNISSFLKTNIGSGGSIQKVEAGLHRLSKLLALLSFALLVYLQFWKWLLSRLHQNKNDNLFIIDLSTKLKKQDWFIITGLTVIAFLLRVFPLTQSLWQDEIGVYSVFIEKGIMATVFPKSSMGTQPFMQILVTIFTNVFGVSELKLRLPIFLIAISSVPLLYFVCIKISGQRNVAVIASAFLILHSYHIYYSFQMRGYAIVVFLCILSVYLFIKLLNSYSKQTGILFIITNLMLIYTHMWAIYYLIAQQLVLLAMLMHQSRKHKLQNIFSADNVAGYFQSFLLFLVFIFLLYLPQLPVLLMNVLNEEGIKISTADYLYQVLSTSYYQITYSDYPLVSWLYAVTTLLLYFFAIKKTIPLLTIFYSAIFLFLITLFTNNPSGFFPRYLICEIPLFIILSATVIAEFWNETNTIKKRVSIFLVICFIGLSISGYPKTYRTIQNFKGAVEFVHGLNTNEDKIIVANSLGKTEIQFYDNQIIALDNVQQLDSLVSLNKNIYAIVTFREFVGRSSFLEDKETQIKIEKQFKHLKTFDGEFPVDVWYYHK